MKATSWGILIALVSGGLLAYSSLFTVYQTEQVLILQLGEPRNVIDEPGLAYKLPLIENVVRFDKRVLDYDLATKEIPTSDQKQVLVDAFSRYRIIEPLKFFQTVTNEIGMQSRLESIVESNLRSVFGNVPLELVLTEQRADLMNTIFEQVKRESVPFGIEVIDVRLKRVDLPENNSKAIFERMRTQREQEARFFRAEGDKKAQEIRADADKQVTVIKAEAQKQAEILMGQGDAQAQNIYNNAYGRDVDFFDFWVSLNALREGLGNTNTRYIGPPSGDFYRYFGDIEGKKQR